MEKILISACLLGDPVRYDGQAKTIQHDLLTKWQAEGRLIPLCPEVAGGLPTPRAPAEVNRSNGDTVLAKDGFENVRVLTQAGEDVSEQFIKGAEMALSLCKKHNIKYAVLTAKSPSCGSGKIYDGSFSSVLVDGDGITTSLLRRYGIQVVDQFAIEALSAQLG